ncbi:MAG: hypothetical protein AAFQ82_27960, partial [Myxococcota bacterium]
MRGLQHPAPWLLVMVACSGTVSPAEPDFQLASPSPAVEDSVPASGLSWPDLGQPNTTQLLRYGNFELDRTLNHLGALLAPESWEPIAIFGALPGEEVVRGYRNMGAVLTVSSELVSAWHGFTQISAERISEALLHSCGETPCFEQALARTGRLAFRRPLDPDELE